jgi:hypothetical protein
MQKSNNDILVVNPYAIGNEIQKVRLLKTEYGYEVTYIYGNGHFVSLPISQEIADWMIELLHAEKGNS